MKSWGNKTSQDGNPFSETLNVWPWMNVKSSAPPSFFLCKLEKSAAWLGWTKRIARNADQALGRGIGSHRFLGPATPGSPHWPAWVRRPRRQPGVGGASKMISLLEILGAFSKEKKGKKVLHGQSKLKKQKTKTKIHSNDYHPLWGWDWEEKKVNIPLLPP